MRARAAIAILAVLLPETVQAQDCSPAKQIDSIQMARLSDTDPRDIISVLVNGQPKKFLLATGSDVSRISAVAAAHLKLPIRPGGNRFIGGSGTWEQSWEYTMPDIPAGYQYTSIDGKHSWDYATPDIQIGEIRSDYTNLPIDATNADNMDGSVAWDILGTTDVEIDFGTDMLNRFSPDHCSGAIPHWGAPIVAEMPFSWFGGHISAPTAIMDGQPLRAELDTRSSGITMYVDDVKNLYHLTPGDADTPQIGGGDQDHRTYRHVFRSLSFGSITVSNPHVTILSDARPADYVPDIRLGMDVLRKLHLYFAMKDKKLYISDALAPMPAGPAPQ